MGGVYGSFKDQGSQPINGLFAFFGMLAVGREGYNLISTRILETVNSLHKQLLTMKEIKYLGDPDKNVVAFQLNPELGLEYGATYALAYEMKKRGVILNTMARDTVHFCVTLRFAANRESVIAFMRVLRESYHEVVKLNKELVSKGQKFQGDAGVYGAIDPAMSPSLRKLSTALYFQNLILGRKGAEEAVRSYFYARLNPYYKSTP